MILSESHIIKPNNKIYKELDNLCFLSKNLYNSTLYRVRQHYFENKQYLSYCKTNQIFAQEKQQDYVSLPAKVSQQTQRLVDSNFKSFFSLLKLKQQGKYDRPIHLPKYLDKTTGRQIVQYTKQAISVKTLKEGYISLSGTSFRIKTKQANIHSIQSVRIVPCNGYIKIEVLYNKQEKELSYCNNSYASIDFGIDNLMTVTSTEFNPIIINGKPVKSINQYYNKTKAELQSVLKTVNNKYTSKRLQRLSLKRTNKINDYFHKASTMLVNHLVYHDVSTLVVGYNKEWKQDTSMNDRNNQNFVQVPFYKLLLMLQYKCRLAGINLVIQEESYTSKASFYNADTIPTYGKDKEDISFSGYRKHRGLYKIKNSNISVNADVNGSYNIMRKYLLQVAENIYDYIDPVVVCSTPEIITVSY